MLKTRNIYLQRDHANWVYTSELENIPYHIDTKAREKLNTNIVISTNKYASDNFEAFRKSNIN